MNKFLSWVFFLSLINHISVGQSINTKTNITLLDSNQINSGRQVILIQNDSFVISTTYEIFTRYLKSIAKTNKNLKIEYDSIYRAVREDSINRIIKILSNISINLKEIVEYIVGDLLQSGKCFAFNKMTKRRIKKVNIIEYGNYNYGATGKKFYLDKILLLDNTEIVF
jgi:hypothetical protein